MSDYSVEVEYKGKSLIRIENTCYGGKAQLTKEEEQIIRKAAYELLSFVGREDESEQSLLNNEVLF
jgi:hypothetical protein